MQRTHTTSFSVRRPPMPHLDPAAPPEPPATPRAATIARLAAAIAALRPGHPTRVAIDGVDGVGKTSLADELVLPLTALGRQVVRASGDGFHHPRARRYRRGADSAAGYFLDSFDHAALRAELLDPLGPGGDRSFRRAVFDHRSDQPLAMPREHACADAILLCDGVFLQVPALAAAWELRVWVDAPFDLTVPRAVRRDTGGTGEHGDRGDSAAAEAEAVRRRYEHRYVPGQQLYIVRCRPQDTADVVFDNADLDHPVLAWRRGEPGTSA